MYYFELANLKKKEIKLKKKQGICYAAIYMYSLEPIPVYISSISRSL